MSLAADEPDPETLGSLEYPFVVVGGSEIESSRGPAAQKLGDAEFGCRPDTVSVEGGLVRPRPQPQPIEQFEPVGLVPQQRLHHVDVPLDKAR